jgi:hypothetical protein
MAFLHSSRLLPVPAGEMDRYKKKRPADSGAQ